MTVNSYLEQRPAGTDTEAASRLKKRLAQLGFADRKLHPGEDRMIDYILGAIAQCPETRVANLVDTDARNIASGWR